MNVDIAIKHLRLIFGDKFDTSNVTRYETYVL